MATNPEPHLLLSQQTTADYRKPPIAEAHLHRLLQRLGGVHATQLRVDRVLTKPTRPPTLSTSCGCSVCPARLR